MDNEVYGSPTIIVKCFGEFSISNGKYKFVADLNKQGQLLILLQYFLINKNRIIPTDELIRLIWKDEKIDNPNNAIKNLVYRLRNFMSDKLHSSKMDYVIHKKGGYIWDETVKIFSDAKEFEHIFLLSQNKNQNIESKLNYLTKSIAIVKGEFMPKCFEIKEANILREKYQNMYLKCICDKSDLLIQMENYKALIELMKVVVPVNNTNETLIYYLIYGLIKDKDLSLTIKAYEMIKSHYTETTGNDLPEVIKNLYNSINVKKEVEKLELNDIITMLDEDDLSGAYYCDYNDFKSYYRLQIRNALRTKSSILIMILSITPLNFGNMQNQQDIINIIRSCCINTLRKGDAISQLSDNQMMILVYNVELENASKITDRIDNKIREYYDKDDVKLEFNVQKATKIN